MSEATATIEYQRVKQLQATNSTNSKEEMDCRFEIARDVMQKIDKLPGNCSWFGRFVDELQLILKRNNLV